MKNYITILALVLSGLVHGQSVFKTEMQQQISVLNQTYRVQDFNSVSKSFKEIALKNNTQWLPYYYAAYSKLNQAFRNPILSNPEKETIAKQATELLKEAESLSLNNIEIHILKARVNSLYLWISPQEHYHIHGKAYVSNIEKAKEINPENPRLLLLEAERLYKTPAKFGGDKVKATKLFNKVISLFNLQTNENSLTPNWGREEAMYFLSL